MKYLIILLISFMLLGVTSQSRSQTIENASFDSLCVCAIDRIWSWVTSDTYNYYGDTVQPFTPNQLYTSFNWEIHMAYFTVQINYDNDPLHYLHSVKLFTRPDIVYPDGEKFRGFIANGHHFYTDGAGYIDFRKGGSPFPYRPYSMTGLYKFEDSLSVIDEYGKAIVLLKSFNSLTNSIDTVGYAQSSIELNPSAIWSPFELVINYYNSAIPDSIVVIFESSSMGNQPTTFWIDDIQFQYITESEELHVDPQFVVYPNPATDILSIDFEKQSLSDIFNMNMYNASGQLILRTDIHSFPYTLDTKDFSPGIYFLDLSCGSDNLRWKLIKR